MQVCLLTNQDLDADPFPADDWPCDPRPFLPEAAWHVAILEKATSAEHVTRLVREGFLRQPHRDMILTAIDPAELLDRLQHESVPRLDKLPPPNPQ